MHELGRLVQVKDDNDAMTLVKISLWRLMKNGDLYVLNGCNKGNSMALDEHETDNVSVQNVTQQESANEEDMDKKSFLIRRCKYVGWSF